MKQAKIIRDLYRSNNPLAIIYNLKSESFNVAFKKLQQSLKFPLAKKYLLNNKNLPKSYGELRAGKFLPNSGNLQGELAYTLISLLEYSEQIKVFLEFEIKIEKALILEDYKLTKELIDKLNTQVGYSFWSLEILFTIEQKLGGTERNWIFLKKINEESNSPFIQLFSSVFSKKAENETTLFQYKRDLESTIYSLDRDECEYLLFKIGEFMSDEITRFPFILNVENSSSIIDKYILFVKILFRVPSNEINKDIVKNIVEKLQNKGIKDGRLLRTLEWFNTITLTDFNERVLNLYDTYSIGNYKKTLLDTTEFLKDSPQSIELYELYIKTLLALNNGFLPTGVSTGVDEILLNLYSIYNKEKDYYTAKENLLKSCICFPNINFYKQLLSLVLFLTEHDSKKNLIEISYFIHSSNCNPNFFAFVRSKSDFQLDKSFLEKHISLRINYHIAKNTTSKLKEEAIPNHKKLLYQSRAEYLFNGQKDLDKYFEVLEDVSIDNYMKEELILHLFEGLVIAQELDRLLNLLVQYSFHNKFMVERINHNFLIEHIIEKDYEIDTISVDLPIYFNLQGVDYYYQFVTLEMYLDSILINRPSDINLNLIQEREKIIYLLKEICTVEVLNNFYMVYDSDDEVIEERIKILRILAQYDLKESAEYLEEVASLIQKQKIGKILQTVNDGKISLNFTRIKDDKESSLENSFNRFLKFSEFSNLNEFKFIDTSNLISQYLSEIVEDSSKLQDASFVAFKSLFFEITDIFLFSKEHGLDGDLSTRIRHGVLENQLRTVFFSNNLIAMKGSDNVYKDLSYWRELCEGRSFKEDIIIQMQEYLKSFSEGIDEIISTIIKEYIQIQSNRHRKKVNGLFNYRFTDEYLWIVFKEVSDKIKVYDDFLNYAFSLLTFHTENNLASISDFFRINLNKNFQDEIAKLQEKAQNLLGSGEVYGHLNQTINNTKTSIQHELYDISKWFKIANNSEDSLLDIETIIQTAVESINIIYPENIKPEIVIGIEKNQFFDLGYYYIDIFKILLENVIKHSGLKNVDKEVSIEVNNIIISKLENLQSITSLEITNSLGNGINVEVLAEKLAKVSKTWNSDLSIVNQEGGSGFQKIKRILMYDIQVLDSQIEFNVANGKLHVLIEITNFYKKE